MSQISTTVKILILAMHLNKIEIVYIYIYTSIYMQINSSQILSLSVKSRVYPTNISNLRMASGQSPLMAPEEQTPFAFDRTIPFSSTITAT